MGLFKKKSDPISERAQSLNSQIAALEAEIARINEAKKETPAPSPPPTPVPAQSVTVPKAKAQNGSNRQPRLRSTARPFGQGSPPAATSPQPETTIPKPAAREPVFEEVDQNRLKNQPETTPKHYNELGVRKYDLPAFWKRVRTHFRGPATSNPKLVNYLAAGSIQGLRPLRYEKRVARNRFLVLVVLLILVMWGIIALFVKRS